MRGGILSLVLLLVTTTQSFGQTVTRPEARPLPPLAEFRPTARPQTSDETASDAEGEDPGQTDAENVPEAGELATRPVQRPEGIAPLPPPDPTAEMRPVARTIERPELARGAQTRPIFRAEQNLFAFSPTATATSLRPVTRPARIVQQAVERRVARQRGQVCGDPAIQGQSVGRVAGRGACGIENAVRVREVAGVTLQPQATIDCRTASALKAWVAQSAKPSVGQMGGGLRSLRVVSHYACRNRNSASTGRLSEHAFGRAIDIAGLGLRNGQEITVLTDWGRGTRGQALRQMWRGACGPFGTVLGPEANRFHRDHFHFDTARYRSGSYCR